MNYTSPHVQSCLGFDAPFSTGRENVGLFLPLRIAKGQPSPLRGMYASA